VEKERTQKERCNMEKNTLVKLWEELLERACVEAAAGMLVDLFRFMNYAEKKWPAEETIDPKFIETSRSFREHRWAHTREVLMDILEDEDGSELRVWCQLYCADPAAFRELARQFARDRNDAHESGLWHEDP
jgi:hypothetical protein